MAKRTNEKKYKITGYPIILVHGAIMKDTFFLRSFGKIDRELRKLGYDVTVADTDGFGSVEHNAETLKKLIEKTVQERKCGKVNVIAYSKGGLDARYTVEQLGAAGLVASLTALCAPHKGTPVASWFLDLPRPLLKFIAFSINTLYRILGDKRPDFIKVCEDMKRTAYGEDVVESVPGIYCQSFSSKYIKGAKKNDLLMRIPYAISRRREKDVVTDGLAPYDSTLFGVCRGDCIQGSFSHSELVDLFLHRSKKPQVYAFYASLCRELAEMGF